ncbi:MAG: hypothetical protein QXW60_06360 [Nitrososphaerota archaeon]
MRRRKSSSGVSAVVGTAIAVMIFFTVMIPMWLYLQQLQTLFMDEVSRRLQFEVEKLNEELEITLTLQPPDINPFGRRSLYLIMMNKGPIEITVPRLYIESSRIGLYPVDEQHKLPPGAIVMQPLNYYVEPGEEVVLRAPTLRGNSFVSGDTIGPNKLPFLLIVHLSNVSLGFRYEVEVSVVSNININEIRGCVSLRSEEFSNGCRGSARSERFVSRVEDLSDVFAFNIAPGVYDVRVNQCPYSSGSCANIAPSPVRVEANSHVVVHIDLRTNLGVPRPLPLQVSPLQQNQMVLLSETDQEAVITIPYIVMLGNITEPLRNVVIQMEVLSMDNLTSPAVGFTLEQSVRLLSPGTSYIGLFTLEVSDAGNQKKDFGGYFVYRIRVVSAEGVITRTSYSDADFQTAELGGVVYVCRWWLEGANVRTSCRAPPVSGGP